LSFEYRRYGFPRFSLFLKLLTHRFLLSISFRAHTLPNEFSPEHLLKNPHTKPYLTYSKLKVYAATFQFVSETFDPPFSSVDFISCTIHCPMNFRPSTYLKTPLQNRTSRIRNSRFMQPRFSLFLKPLTHRFLLSISFRAHTLPNEFSPEHLPKNPPTKPYLPYSKLKVYAATFQYSEASSKLQLYRSWGLYSKWLWVYKVHYLKIQEIVQIFIIDANSLNVNKIGCMMNFTCHFLREPFVKRKR